MEAVAKHLKASLLVLDSTVLSPHVSDCLSRLSSNCSSWLLLMVYYTNGFPIIRALLFVSQTTLGRLFLFMSQALFKLWSGFDFW